MGWFGFWECVIVDIFSRNQIIGCPDTLSFFFFRKIENSGGFGKAGCWLACYLSAAGWTRGLSSQLTNQIQICYSTSLEIPMQQSRSFNWMETYPSSSPLPPLVYIHSICLASTFASGCFRRKLASIQYEKYNLCWKLLTVVQAHTFILGSTHFAYPHSPQNQPPEVCSWSPCLGKIGAVCTVADNRMNWPWLSRSQNTYWQFVHY